MAPALTKEHSSMLTRLLQIFCGSLVLISTVALAHKPSDSYLTLRVTASGLAGEWHLALRDLDDTIGLDLNDDGVITWGELRAQEPAIAAYVQRRLQVRNSEEPGTIQVTDWLVDHHSDGAYAVVRFRVAGLSYPSKLVLRYNAFFDTDALHRGLFRLETASATQVAVFSPTSKEQWFDLTPASTHTMLGAFIREGVLHIWTGYDHILFLLVLLLPGVLARRANRWQPQPSTAPVWKQVLKTVTAFTVAHSLTLTLAALDLVRLPVALVESAIAGSVVLAACNNLFPIVCERTWTVAFGFGLLHGFGFANALRDLGLGRGALAAPLFGFNFGVELGQLAIVLAFLPLALFLRHHKIYRYGILPAGSAGIAVLAAGWLVERSFGVHWLPF
jgi:hypothetical protein